MVVSVMDYDSETVLVDVLEQDRQACYDAVTIAGAVLNTKSWYGGIAGKHCIDQC